MPLRVIRIVMNLKVIKWINNYKYNYVKLTVDKDNSPINIIEEEGGDIEKIWKVGEGSQSQKDQKRLANNYDCAWL